MPDYNKGDVVRFIRTFKIDEVSKLGNLFGRDVQSNKYVTFPIKGDGSCRLEMVRKAPVPKPEAGAVIKGADVKRIQWKRGTIIQCFEGNCRASAIVLKQDARWYCLDNEDWNEFYEFDELDDLARFELRFVA